MPETSLEREMLQRILFQKQWFRNSGAKIMQQISGLPETFNGFIADLAMRNENIGPFTILRMTELVIPKDPNALMLTVTFLVKNQAGLEKTFSYNSWRHGSTSGAKGIVLIRDKNSQTISHIILLNGMRFGAGCITYDCPGGFAEENETTESEMETRFKTETVEEFGLSSLPPHKVISLGRIYPDPGAMNNHPFLFALILSSEYLCLFSNPQGSNPDPFEPTYRAIIPISQLAEFIDKCDNAYLHICLTRLWARGIALFSDMGVLSTATH